MSIPMNPAHGCNFKIASLELAISVFHVQKMNIHGYIVSENDVPGSYSFLLLLIESFNVIQAHY